jgi:hypothetical protein
MAVTMKGLNPIYRCKHCKQFPNTVIEQAAVPTWGGGTVTVTRMRVHCPTDPNIFAEHSGGNVKWVSALVYQWWNSTFGEKP